MYKYLFFDKKVFLGKYNSLLNYGDELKENIKKNLDARYGQQNVCILTSFQHYV